MSKILLVEDQDEVRWMLGRYLERADYHVEEAPDGEVALELYRENPADLVVTDLMMPRKSGLELIMNLRCEWPHVKIIAISTSEKMLAQARLTGAAETLRKPFLPSKLLEIIKQMLEGSR